MNAKKPDSTTYEPWYNWPAAPEWTTHAAVDADGDAYWYGPLFSGREVWSTRYSEIDKKDFNLNGCPWDKSLRTRPGKESNA
jgi:hypothetical protein